MPGSMPQTVRTSPALLALAWAVVTLPTLWGLSYTVRNAAKLFTHTPAAAPPGNPGPITPAR